MGFSRLVVAFLFLLHAPTLLAGMETSLPVQRNERQPATALALATYARNEKMVDDLLRAGESPDGIVSDGVSLGDTPLMTAAQTGAEGCAKRLLSAGADPLVINRGGQDALYFAQKSHNDVIVRMIYCAFELEAEQKFSDLCL